MQSYFESALNTLKSKFWALKERFDNISHHFFESESQKKDNVRHDYIVTRYDDQLYNRSVLQPWNQLSHLDKELYELDRQLSLWDRDFNALASNMADFSRLMDRDFLSPMVESLVPGVDEQSGKYIVNVPLGKNLSPEDLKISLKDRVMTIEAKKEHKSEDGKSRSYHEFMRKFTLPENVRREEVKSLLTPEGYLKIEAPLPQEALPEPAQLKEIPIQFT